MTRKDPREDDELLAAWKSGDKLAGIRLVERHHENIARFFMHKVGESDGADLSQATFVGLLEGIDRFRGEASFRTWIFAVAHNILLKHLRNRCRDQRRFAPEETSLEALVGPSPVSILAAEQQNRLMLVALRRLAIDTQVMLELHYWENLAIREIAVVFDMPVNTIKTRMRRGRLQLFEAMQALAESPEQLETTQRGLEGWAAGLRRELDDD